MDVVFHLKSAKVEAIHDNEFLAETIVLWQYVVTLAGLTVGLIGHFNSLSEAEACIEFSEKVHNG